MAKTEKTGAVTPFGVEESAETAATTSTGAITGFLETGALPLIAALVIAAFLIFQFVRWFLANYKVEGMDRMLAERDDPGVPAAQMPAETGRKKFDPDRLRKD